LTDIYYIITKYPTAKLTNWTYIFLSNFPYLGVIVFIHANRNLAVLLALVIQRAPSKFFVVPYSSWSMLHILNSDKEYSFLFSAFAFTPHLLMLIHNPITHNCPLLLQVHPSSPSSSSQMKTAQNPTVAHYVCSLHTAEKYSCASLLMTERTT